MNGSFPLGLTLPKITWAMELPASEPQNQHWAIDLTCRIHGMATAFPLTRHTARLGFAAASASMTASWLYGRPYAILSAPSLS